MLNNHVIMGKEELNSPGKYHPSSLFEVVWSKFNLVF